MQPDKHVSFYTGVAVSVTAMGVLANVGRSDGDRVPLGGVLLGPWLWPLLLVLLVVAVVSDEWAMRGLR